MTRNELIKQAYAYGAAVALQELGYAPYDAQQAGVKLAMEKEALSGAEARAALETLLSPATGAARSAGGAISGAAKNVAGQAKRHGGDLLAALRGSGNLPSNPLVLNPDAARMARLGLGAGALGGAGLGVGGMALGNALSD